MKEINYYDYIEESYEPTGKPTKELARPTAKSGEDKSTANSNPETITSPHDDGVHTERDAGASLRSEQ